MSRLACRHKAGGIVLTLESGASICLECASYVSTQLRGLLQVVGYAEGAPVWPQPQLPESMTNGAAPTHGVVRRKRMGRPPKNAEATPSAASASSTRRGHPWTPEAKAKRAATMARKKREQSGT